MSHEAIDLQIQTAYDQYLADRTNMAYAKVIAKLFADKGDYASAVGWYQHAFEIGGKIDSSLEKLIGELKLKKSEFEVDGYRSALAEQTDPDLQAAYLASIAEKKAELEQIGLKALLSGGPRTELSY